MFLDYLGVDVPADLVQGSLKSSQCGLTAAVDLVSRNSTEVGTSGNRLRQLGIKTRNFNFQIHPSVSVSHALSQDLILKQFSHLLNLLKVVGHAGRSGHVGHLVSLLEASDPRDARERLRLAGGLLWLL